MVVDFGLSDIKTAANTLLASSGVRRVIALEGEMGAGKTTLITAICKLLGVTDNISSPTFSIINEYRTRDGEVVYHMDLYRVDSEEEAYNAGIVECIHSGSWCFIEWPERIPGLFRDNVLRCTLTIEKNSLRRLEINL